MKMKKKQKNVKDRNYLGEGPGGAGGALGSPPRGRSGEPGRTWGDPGGTPEVGTLFTDRG